MNPELVICHLDEGATLNMEITADSGKGYVPAVANRPADAPIGLIPVDSHIPERAQRALPAMQWRPPVHSSPAHWPTPPEGEPPMRPLFLFDPPQPVEVVAEVPDGPPHRFRWRSRLPGALPIRWPCPCCRRSETGHSGTLKPGYCRTVENVRSASRGNMSRKATLRALWNRMSAIHNPSLPKTGCRIAQAAK